jgi:hypothetical protein
MVYLRLSGVDSCCEWCGRWGKEQIGRFYNRDEKQLANSRCACDRGSNDEKETQVNNIQIGVPARQQPCE